MNSFGFGFSPTVEVQSPSSPASLTRRTRLQEGKDACNVGMEAEARRRKKSEGVFVKKGLRPAMKMVEGEWWM